MPHSFDLRPGPAFGRYPAAGVAALLLCAALAAPLRAAGNHPGPAPFQARTGVAVAREAAAAWSPDAALVYLENDEPVDEAGAAARWSYLFYSPALDQLRFYSVRDGQIKVAETLSLKFEAPPLAAEWIDSGAALRAAEEGEAGEFRTKAGGRLSNMLLMRGAFSDKEPDQTTWTLVYTAPDAPSLFVVVDAAAGKVRRTWRG